MKKRLLAGITCVLLAGSMLTLSGCQKQQTEVVAVCQPLEAIKQLTPAHPSVQVYNSVLEFGVATIEDFVKAGAQFVPTSSIQSIDFWEDPLAVRNIDFLIGPTTLHTVVKNMSNESTKIRTSVVLSGYFDGQQSCGVGGIMLGDSLDAVKEKLGEPFAIINSENYVYNSGGASMPSNSRVYVYQSQLDDFTLSLGVDRNSYMVMAIDQRRPYNLITEPKQVPEGQIKALSKEIKKTFSNKSSVSAVLMDAKNKTSKTNDSSISGKLTSINLMKLRIMTLNDFGDGAEYYNKVYKGRISNVQSSFMVLEYQATLTLNAGTDEQTRQDVYGCFYIPKPYLTDEGVIESAANAGSTLYEWPGVYLSEDAMLEALFSSNDLGYTYSNYTSMERAI